MTLSSTFIRSARGLPTYCHEPAAEIMFVNMLTISFPVFVVYDGLRPIIYSIRMLVVCIIYGAGTWYILQSRPADHG